MTRRDCLAALLSLVGLAAGCGAREPEAERALVVDAGPDATAEVDAAFGGCASACEMRIRPHVIVGLYPDDERAAAVRVSMKAAHGTQSDTRAKGVCPAEIPEASCSFVFNTTPSDVKVQLILEDGAEPPLTFELTVGAFNNCSRDIAYVPLHRDDAGGGWSMAATRYISPCDTL